jgi:hypothetical protein
MVCLPALLYPWNQESFAQPQKEIFPQSYDRTAPRSDLENQRCLRSRGHASAGNTEAQGVSIVVSSTHLLSKEAVWLVDAKPHSPSASLQRNA